MTSALAAILLKSLINIGDKFSGSPGASTTGIPKRVGIRGKHLTQCLQQGWQLR